MKTIQICIMTKDRESSLIDVLRAAYQLHHSCFNVSIGVFDSSTQFCYENNKKFISKHKGCQHIRLPEHTSMAENWNAAVCMYERDYVLIVTDRSILYKDMLIDISKVLMENKTCEVVSWGWDVYFNDEISKYDAYNKKDFILTEDDYINALAFYGFCKYPYYLPRGLNMIIGKNALNIINKAFGNFYGGINPDYSIAYRLMLLNIDVRFLDKALFCSAFTELSNGGKSTTSLNYDYLKTVPSYGKILANSSIELPLCSNTIFCDILFDIDKLESNEKICELKEKILFSGYTATRLELKRFLSNGIVSKIQYEKSVKLINNDLKKIKKNRIPIRIMLHFLLVLLLPKFLLVSRR